MRYSFDDGLLDSGPDTFSVFAHANGMVELASDIRYSGYHSIRIRDSAGDGDFPELQGYFPVRAEGRLQLHFAMLVATPRDTLNIALAGPSWFNLKKDGIAFWLKTREGFLTHVSDGIPKKLFAVEPFVWYVVDVDYDIDHGTYALTIRREGNATPIIALQDQPNATSSEKSAVQVFSFVGDVEQDETSADYYVDDILVSTDRAVSLPPFVAPGRRKLFVDAWRDYVKANSERRGCPPLLRSEDAGPTEGRGERIDRWRSACEALSLGKAAEALRDFERLSKEAPESTLFELSSIVALTRLGRWDDANARWSAVRGRMRDDLRFGFVASSMAMHAEGDDAELAERAPDEHYFVLLFKHRYDEASALATRMAKSAEGEEKRWWTERIGDAQFLAGHPNEARPFYESAQAWTKLSDVFWLLGDREGERKYREKVYGRIR